MNRMGLVPTACTATRICLLILACAPASATTRFVNLASTNPVPGYTAWELAATNIHDAVGVAVSGDTVLVTNGTYHLASQINITNAISMRSVNGAPLTTLHGGDSVRCIRITHSNALVDGFTISHGTGFYDSTRAGGGLYFAASGTVANCIIQSNYAYSGGGVYGGVVTNCLVIQNKGNSDAGGVERSHVIASVIKDNLANETGGGARYSLIEHSKLIDNRSRWRAGGAEECDLRNCLVRNNTADSRAGGLYGGSARNCTITSNSAPSAGGADAALLLNCIVYYNSATEAPDLRDCSAFHCCVPIATGVNTVTNTPLFLAPEVSDYRLRYGSPCIDAGTNLYPLIDDDIGFRVRPLDGDYDDDPRYDIGAWEYDPGTVDTDGDGLTDGEERVTDTDPTNSLSVFAFTAITGPAPVLLYFPSSSNRNYSLLKSTNMLDPVWSPVGGQQLISGTGNEMSLSDTNDAPVQFYELRVSE